MYVNVFMLSVPEERKDDYLKVATLFDEMAKDHGALEIVETWEVDVPDGERTDFRKAVQAPPGEKIVVSWMTWPDRETADKAHEAMNQDPRMELMGEMPFDGKRMVFGSFESIIHLRTDG